MSSASGQSPVPALPLSCGPAQRASLAPARCCAELSASGCWVESKQIRLVRSSGPGASPQARGYRAACGSRCGRGGY